VQTIRICDPSEGKKGANNNDVRRPTAQTWYCPLVSTNESGGKLRSDSIGKGSETRSRRLLYRKGSENSDTHPIKHLNVFRFASFWLLGVAQKNPILPPSLPIPMMIGLTLRTPVGTVAY